MSIPLFSQLRVYAILLGDFGLFNRESFFSVFSVCLIVLYTFMVVLVLLNVLIAVASDSVREYWLHSVSSAFDLTIEYDLMCVIPLVVLSTV
jgi:hypothetical protein